MIVDANTDLERYLGKRVRIVRAAAPDGPRSVHFGVFESLWFSQRMPDSVGGMLIEEPHDTCKGGATGFHVPYGSTITIVPAAVPPLEGAQYGSMDLRYRVWTIDHGLDFDDMPAYDDGGPAIVVVGGWSKSVESLSLAWSSPSVVAAHDGKVTLHISREGNGPRLVRHPLDGTRYDTKRGADRAAYQAGVTGFMVYERDAYRYDALLGVQLDGKA